ncbi:hypothetical protein Pyrde_1953 [Pyrodictium delaneyi]|uniref:Uncharacterized protein n=1 Tax=Pyrodictium delaneyi TaxID=1273541 RepID=A0A0P0N5J6_9CREN|nr:hypothetical protein Pyrde_1953 [Pyrodictium delaneyi]
MESRANPSDVLDLARIAQLYEKATRTNHRLIMVTGYIGRRTYEVAARNNVEVYEYLDEE